MCIYQPRRPNQPGGDDSKAHRLSLSQNPKWRRWRKYKGGDQNLTWNEKYLIRTWLTSFWERSFCYNDFKKTVNFVLVWTNADMSPAQVDKEHLLLEAFGPGSFCSWKLLVRVFWRTKPETSTKNTLALKHCEDVLILWVKVPWRGVWLPKYCA